MSKKIIVGYREQKKDFIDRVVAALEDLLQSEDGYLNQEVFVILEKIKEST